MQNDQPDLTIILAEKVWKQWSVARVICEKKFNARLKKREKKINNREMKMESKKRKANKKNKNRNSRKQAGAEDQNFY